MPAVADSLPTLPAKRRNVGRATALEIVVVLPPLSRSGGKATRTSGVVRVLSDEVSRGQGRRCRCPPVRTKVSRFRGERVGRRTVALRLSPTLAPPLPVEKNRCAGCTTTCDYGQIAREASPRAKSGGDRETELREPQSGELRPALELGGAPVVRRGAPRPRRPDRRRTSRWGPTARSSSGGWRL